MSASDKDIDIQETREWTDSIASVIQHQGPERAQFLLKCLISKATESGEPLPPDTLITPYRNTIPVSAEEKMPGDMFMERSIRGIVRWNALAMVQRANALGLDLGGHISSFASSATLYDVGFNYFFRGETENQPADLVFFQGHSSPGIYSRSYLEGRLSEDQLDHFRQEVDGKGLSSYPHPHLMPDYWQFPTVSMGLGPIQAIYQAHVMKYLDNRDQVKQGDRQIWAFLGDGECDEPESLGAISLAGRESLGNLNFVINCNLQRLDGPVRGNGKIIQELEGIFRGAGWNVIKVVWGRHWDALLAQDTEGLLQRRMDEVVDGEYQTYASRGGAYTREHFFGKSPELLKMVEHLSDDDIMKLNRGGHDPFKVYAAYKQAVETTDRPTVILAKTIKGYAFPSVEGSNPAHNTKKLNEDSLKKFRDRFGIPVPDEKLEEVPYYRPEENSPEMQYMRKRREALGGVVPQRRTSSNKLETPGLSEFESITAGTGDREVSTTMAFVRLISTLLKDKKIGKQIVPIVPDEARTFGMEGLFRQVAIYSAKGQLYDPADSGQVMYYREDIKGQILEEGINEAGAISSWLAVATSYSVNNYPLIPFYIYYSMFGFQRVGDLCWAAGDLQARGFLIGGTAGRTTLNGEGLQHQDGHSHILANTIPNCVTYDPTYAYELAVIVQHGMKRMYQDDESVFYYITTMNENYIQPEMPKGSEEGIIKGMYLLEDGESKDYKVTAKDKKRVRLLGSGTILREVREAAEILRKEYKVSVDVWSTPSFNELARDGQAAERWNMMHPEKEARVSYVEQCLGERDGPVVVSTDYMKLYGEQIRAFVPAPFKVLGTDGFGRSDSRQKLRHFFEVDRNYIVLAALNELARSGDIEKSTVSKAIKKMKLDPEKINPMLA
ncbi:MAG: pyruvate dehydrogenase (acetyl-transferring), homodimeric type [Gammaproteobacteria bacterium]|nr:pyruvate dehydrogenase (acetyl-transferring), homodimeric type [Gammaproteobacteria bacterium]|tara:strand:+ start:110028 stop:112709 length:2682 start_codon:yes stop_codon:yes gene_type:complete